MIYTWQKGLWERLLAQVERLPHALLLAGPAGGGKSDFAQSLAARLLCERAGGLAESCGSCPSCKWFQAGNHPDFRLVEPGGGEADEIEADEIEAEPERVKNDPSRSVFTRFAN